MDPSLDAGSHAWPLSRAGEPEGWGLFLFCFFKKGFMAEGGAFVLYE